MSMQRKKSGWGERDDCAGSPALALPDTKKPRAKS